METCRLIRPIKVHPPGRSLDGTHSGRTRCRTENHPISSLLNLSTRRRGDVETRPKLLLALREDKNEKQSRGGGGPKGPDRTGPPTTCAAQEKTVGHQEPRPRDIAPTPFCDPELPVVHEVTATFWAPSNHRGGTGSDLVVPRRMEPPVESAPAVCLCRAAHHFSPQRSLLLGMTLCSCVWTSPHATRHNPEILHRLACPSFHNLDAVGTIPAFNVLGLDAI